MKFLCEYGWFPLGERRQYRPCQLEKGHTGPHQDGYGHQHEKGWKIQPDIRLKNYIRSLGGDPDYI